MLLYTQSYNEKKRERGDRGFIEFKYIIQSNAQQEQILKFRFNYKSLKMTKSWKQWRAEEKFPIREE